MRLLDLYHEGTGAILEAAALLPAYLKQAADESQWTLLSVSLVPRAHFAACVRGEEEEERALRNMLEYQPEQGRLLLLREEPRELEELLVAGLAARGAAFNGGGSAQTTYNVPDQWGGGILEFTAQNRAILFQRS